ncbi:MULTISPECIES: serine O-acetyltransferase [unclassified Luteococcus]|uniref:serine O-acetyltransferase n=1 Tax=unclassified Luteococcus TaxID=2639923 RepID=UPI00313C7321
MTDHDHLVTTGDSTEGFDTQHGAGWKERISAPPRRGWVRALTEKVPLVGQLREDMRANEGLLRPGFQALAVNRVGAWAATDQAPKPLRAPARVISRAGQVICRNVYGIDLPETVQVGRRVRIVEQHGIVIHPFSVIGDDCIIRQGATLGAISGDPERYAGEAPRLGRNVSVGVNACVLGDVEIGDDVQIGPNATVMDNVPARAVVLSPKSRVMRPE